MKHPLTLTLPTQVELMDLVKPMRVPFIGKLIAKFVGFRYKVWLAALREISIYTHLIINFDKLDPEKFKEYKRIKFLKSSKIMNRLIFATEMKLRRRIY